MRQWYQRWKRKKPIRIARALVAKELAKSVYVVLHEQVDFNHEFKGTPLTPQKKAQWRGECWDNAAVESFFASLKVERLAGRRYATIEELRIDVSDYIERSYNRQRLHSTLEPIARRFLSGWRSFDADPPGVVGPVQQRLTLSAPT